MIKKAFTRIKVTKDKTLKQLKALETVAKKEVLIGIPTNRVKRKDEEGFEVNNAYLGFIHEYGSPVNNIPPRPFLTVGIARSQVEIKNYMFNAGVLALDGNINEAIKILNKIGLICQNKVRDVFVNNNWEPLSEKTIKYRDYKHENTRKNKTFTGYRPLIDTGQLRKSITYAIKDKE